MNAAQIEHAAEALQHHFGTATTVPAEDGYEVGYLVERGYDYDLAVAAVMEWWDRPAKLQRQQEILNGFWDAVECVHGRFNPANQP